jgi:hypothetical protein
VLSLLNEGNKKFDMILGNLRNGALASIGKRTLQMVAQRHQSGDPKWAQLATDMLGDDAQAVISVLDLDTTTIDEGLGIEVTSTSSQVNKEVEKQNLIGLMQFMSTAYPQLIQAAQMIGDQNLMIQAASASYFGGSELLKRLLEAFDIQNPERYLPPTGNAGQPQNGGQQLGGGQAPQLGGLEALFSQGAGPPLGLG